MSGAEQPPGWYPAQGDPPGTVRWWDGTKWVGGPQEQGVQQQAGYVAPGAGTLASGRELADPWIRIAAALIDVILVSIVGLVFSAPSIVSAIGDNDSTFQLVPSGSDIALALVAAVLIASYYTLMNTYMSGGLGKQLLGLRIIGREGEEPLGVPLGPKRSLNHIVNILSSVPFVNILVGIALFVLNIVSLVFIFNDPEHRTVMDRFADTYVVKKA